MNADLYGVRRYYSLRPLFAEDMEVGQPPALLALGRADGPSLLGRTLGTLGDIGGILLAQRCHPHTTQRVSPLESDGGPAVRVHCAACDAPVICLATGEALLAEVRDDCGCGAGLGTLYLFAEPHLLICCRKCERVRRAIPVRRRGAAEAPGSERPPASLDAG